MGEKIKRSKKVLPKREITALRYVNYFKRTAAHYALPNYSAAKQSLGIKLFFSFSFQLHKERVKHKGKNFNVFLQSGWGRDFGNGKHREFTDLSQMNS